MKNREKVLGDIEKAYPGLTERVFRLTNEELARFFIERGLPCNAFCGRYGFCHVTDNGECLAAWFELECEE